MLDAAWLIPSLPAIAFFVILFVGKRAPKHGAEIGILAVGSSFVLSCVALVEWINRVEEHTGGESHGIAALANSIFAQGPEHGVAPVTNTITWWTSGGTHFGVGTTVDGLTVMMMFVVTLISLLVQIYSTAYMHDDRRFTWFFACLSLFTASMLTLVVSENLLQLLVGWELVGLCSFMLIGHWWEDRANSRAAIKAFLTTRVGDIGLMIGVIILFFAAGTFSIVGINEYALGGGADHDLLMFGGLCLFIGIIGKSGQFPLHTWLPDAMAGPTPVSALIHAATMVVAGVYLGARVYPVFYEGFNIADGGANFMAIIGGITIIIGAVLAFVQRDIKRVLAYSTISQLGYMVMALGVGAWTAAVFHLFTHAFFKALLFLGAGSVSHSGSHHSFDMKSDMGGLRKYMPTTFATFMIGSLALAGIFPLAGFWSKDEILATAGESGFDAFVIVGLVGAVLTAAYMTRCVYLTFFGEYRGHGHPHESPRAITMPLIVLAAFSVLAGLINAVPLGIEKFKEWFEPTFAFPHLTHAEFDYGLAIASVALAGLAIGVAAYLWFQKEELGPFRGLTQRSPIAAKGYTFLENKYYLDHLYENVIVDGTRGAVARAFYWFDQHIVDGIVNTVGRTAARVGRFAYDVIDQRGVDGSINAIAAGTGEAGSAVRTVQSGRVQRYALMLFASVGVMALAVFLANTL